MRKTQFRAVYELKDVTAIGDSIPSTMDNMDFANESFLKQNAEFPNYGTLEKDFFYLDGSMPELPDEPEKIAFWTSGLSDENGKFTENPVLILLFTKQHTSPGLTFHFVGDWPLQMQIRYYDFEDNMIALESYSPDCADYYARGLVEDYGKIEINFQRTLPYRYVKLYGIDYGVVITWDDRDIKKATLVEETDPISNTMKVNKLTFWFVDEQNEFNPSNSGGLHKALQKNQHIEPYELINGEPHFLGRYFLKTPGNDKTTAKLEATDYIGLLDDTDFLNGRVYNGESAGAILADIFSGTGIPYEVDEEIAETKLYGHLKIQNRRKALREVLFACGAAAETARLEKVRIYKPGHVIQSNIGKDRKFSTTTTQDEYISDVSIKFPVYSEGAEEKELLKETVYPAGENTVQFSDPVSDIRISVGTIVEAKANYLTFRLEEAASVTVYGKQYEKQEITVTSSVGKLKAGKSKKVKSFTGTLFNYEQARKISQTILDYYQLSLELSVRHLMQDESPGMWVDVENTLAGHGGYAAGIESMSVDLTGGYISTTKLRGYYKYTAEYYRAGMELYAAEGSGIL